jgi:lysophospholipase L1-like esterase
VTYSLPSATGGTLPLSIGCTPPSGSSFEVGTTPVSCTASDAAGRTATCNFAVTIVHIPQLTQNRLLVFGNSVAEGKLSALVESPPHSYPAKLLHLMQERYRGQDVTILNEGRGGERAVESLPRFQAAVSLHRPGAVLLMHGINDLNTEGISGVQRVADAIEELVKHARATVPVTFVATLPPLGPGPKAGCPECVEPLNARIRAVAAAKSAVLVDVHAAWGARTGLMGADGIHPTEAGYEAIAEAFFEAIRRTLEAAPSSP